MRNKQILIVSIVILALGLFVSSFMRTEPSVFMDNNPPLLKENIKGLSFVAPPRPFSDDPMISIKNVNAEWIAVIPYAFIPKDDHTVHYNENHRWWGESVEGAIATIQNAKAHNLKVMLKPQIWVRGSWIGDFDAGSPEKWKAWEETYETYLMTYARIAADHHADMICIGTEVKQSMKQRPEFWSALIQKIRNIYDGPLTYSSNWDEFEEVPVWDELDYIGISAYFPLTDTPTPTLQELEKKWKPRIRQLRKFSHKHQKQILFTEFGYLSLDGCAGKTWILETERDLYNENPEAQAIAIHALMDAFWHQDFWAGGFIWKWYPEMREGRDDYYRKDYTPQGKMAEQTLAEWYKK